MATPALRRQLYQKNESLQRLAGFPILKNLSFGGIPFTFGGWPHGSDKPAGRIVARLDWFHHLGVGVTSGGLVGSGVPTVGVGGTSGGGVGSMVPVWVGHGV
ncbi:hypothetical protein ATHL_02301 [Anaerolinea thermolimosa]|nr:hypothetical protein ATHL_02301 [Anaerolinea thermolimosa]